MHALTPEQTFRKYTTHTLLYTFGRALFGSYGTLLVYAKTQSIAWTILFWTISYSTGTLVRAFGIAHTWGLLRRVGAASYMALGIVIASIATALIGVLDPNTAGFFPLLVLVAMLFQIGMSLYWVLSNAILFNTVGHLEHAGKHSSIIAITRRLASLLAAAIGVALSGGTGFTWLLPASALLTLASILPLRGMSLEIPTSFSVRSSLRALSVHAVLSNIRVTPALEGVGLPLILLGLGLSLQTSAWVGGATIAASMLIAYIAGHLEAKNGRGLTYLAIALAMGVWVGYALASVPAVFVVIGIFWSLAATIIEVDGDARLCREVTDTGHPIEETVALEAMRVGGVALGCSILLAAYLLTGSLPQAILLLGVVVVLPQGLYALGGIEEGSALRTRGHHGGSARHCVRHAHHLHEHGHRHH